MMLHDDKKTILLGFIGGALTLSRFNEIVTCAIGIITLYFLLYRLFHQIFSRKSSEVKIKHHRRNHKMKIFFALPAVVLCTLAGCSLFGTNPAPPSAFEQSHFDITTNRVVTTNVVSLTNAVQVTNVVLETKWITNVDHTVLATTITNTQVQFIPQYVTVTNVHTVETYDYKPNANAAALTGTAGALAGFSGVPGLGTIVGIAGAALWGLWGTLRSNRTGKALAASTQVVATAEQVIGSASPKLMAEFQAWKDKHHEVAGVADTINKFVQDNVDNPDARNLANQIAALAGSAPRVTPVSDNTILVQK